MTIRYHIQDIDSVAKKVFAKLSSKIILLEGDMGAGKTTFAKAFLKVLNSKDEVSSPTFSIVNDYELENGDIVHHFDLYRVKDSDEALQFGIEEYFYSNRWVLVEWAEKAQSLIPEKVDRIHITMNADGSRTLKLNENSNLTKKYGIKLHEL